MFSRPLTDFLRSLYIIFNNRVPIACITERIILEI